jgi:soluble lytic murein transglycosylase
LGEHQAQVLRVAYPDRYWAEVQQATAGYRFEPRLFHALCREESNFNVRIVSHAGAIGLAQLMPYTARDVASWMGTTVTTADLNDPAINARLGARYLEQVHKQLGGSTYLAVAAYNAGPGRVNQWLGEFGNVPTDEYVEMIPFRETRHYVKRVMGSWQTYRYQFDTGPLFYDLSAYNHEAMKKDS